jgi:hypothetical protein
VLARLDQLDGVECSFVNESGTLIRLSLRPEADPAKVAEGVRRILRQAGEDGVPGPPGREASPLGEAAAAAALLEEQWRDRTQEVAALAATDPLTSVRLALALLLVCVVVALRFLWWWRRELALLPVCAAAFLGYLWRRRGVL